MRKWLQAVALVAGIMAATGAVILALVGLVMLVYHFFGDAGLEVLVVFALLVVATFVAHGELD